MSHSAAPPHPDAHWRILALTSPDVPASTVLVSALRDLGHHVLEVDLEGHRLIPPSQDGAPAPEVDAAGLQPFVDAFSPQVIASLGPRARLSETAGQALRTGHVLLGLQVTSSGGAEPGPGRGHDLELTVPPPQTDQEAARLWEEALGALRSASPTDLPGLDAERRARVAELLSVTVPAAKKVIVSGYYGAGNLGDELILASIEQALRRSDPAVQVTVAAENRWAAERAHGLQAYARPDHAASAREVRTAAAVVLGGGGLWHDYSFARSGGLLSFVTGARMSVAGYGILPLMAAILDRPFHVVGMGAGPLTSPEARSSVRFLTQLADTLSVRDPESAALLTELSVPAERIVTGPDVVYAMDLPPRPRRELLPERLREALGEGHTAVGLNLRSWAEADMATVVDQVAQALGDLAAAGPLTVVSVPLQWGQDRDQGVVRKVLDRLPKHVVGVEFEHRPSVEELAALFAELDVLLAMRLHASLLAHRLGLPAVGLGYDPKVSRHFQEVGRAEFCLPLDSPADLLRERLEAARRDGLPTSARQRVQELESSARSTLHTAADRIAATGRPRTTHLEAARQAAAEARAVRAASGAAGSGTKGLPAMFAGMRFAAQGVPDPGTLPRHRHRAASRELRLCLDTPRPRAGQHAGWTGRLEVPGSGGHLVELALECPWTNPKARGTVFVELEVPGASWSQDLSLEGDPVRFQVLVESTHPTDLTLRLAVRQDGFSAGSWASATTCGLTIGAVHAVGEPGAAPLMASSGTVRRGTAQS